MSTKNTPAASPAATQSAPATPPVKVLVRITTHGTHALGGVWAKGAQVRMSKAKADALVSLGAATIIGI